MQTQPGFYPYSSRALSAKDSDIAARAGAARKLRLLRSAGGASECTCASGKTETRDNALSTSLDVPVTQTVRTTAIEHHPLVTLGPAQPALGAKLRKHTRHQQRSAMTVLQRRRQLRQRHCASMPPSFISYYPKRNSPYTAASQPSSCATATPPSRASPQPSTPRPHPEPNCCPAKLHLCAFCPSVGCRTPFSTAFKRLVVTSSIMPRRRHVPHVSIRPGQKKEPVLTAVFAQIAG